jgi:hypothetical protein
MEYLGFQGPEWSHTTESMGQRTPLLKSMYVVWWLALVACSDVVEMREYKRIYTFVSFYHTKICIGFVWYPEPTQTILVYVWIPSLLLVWIPGGWNVQMSIYGK